MFARSIMFAAAALAFVGTAGAQGIIRNELPGTPPPGRAFPILDSAAVPAGAETLYVSGKVPRPLDPKAPREQQSFGDTEAQALDVLNQIAASLERAGWSKNDVVKMHVYLVPDPKTGRIDFTGFSRAYDQHFGTRETPTRVARTTVGIAQLINPAWLVEIDVVAARIQGEARAAAAPAKPADGLYRLASVGEPGHVLPKHGDLKEPTVRIAQAPSVAATEFRKANVRNGRVRLELSGAGRAQLADMTSRAIGQRIAVVVDGTVIAAPNVVERIMVGELDISGDDSGEELIALAKRLAPRN
jgi:enamine deaminase RidA (YjgF/YER057c/UK114 family)